MLSRDLASVFAGMKRAELEAELAQCSEQMVRTQADIDSARAHARAWKAAARGYRRSLHDPMAEDAETIASLTRCRGGC